MAWKKQMLGCITTLGLGALVALPAGAAKITFSTDSRGIIHITNDALDTSQSDKLSQSTAPDLEPKDKNDKLRLFFERREKLATELGKTGK